MISVGTCSRRLWWVVVVALAGCGSCATSGKDRHQPPQQRQLNQAVAPPARSAPPEYIPDAARAMLRMRMVSHAKNMTQLMSAVAVLRYRDAEQLADELVDDASLARPVGTDATELNSLLPARYFTLQDEARADARAVAEAAHHLNAIDLGRAYGHLAQGCVDCHALFRPAVVAGQH
ncbi:MAG TPA: hypothetical protein VNO55_06770 [Polyangia bacterium]|nr:hypothetical protein [Polyangia bacterium]